MARGRARHARRRRGAHLRARRSGLSYTLSTEEDVLVLLAAIASLTEDLLFDRRRSFELSLALREIGGNVVRHASGGQAELRTIESGDRRGIEIVVSDGGPGIADLEQALRDGFSTKGSLGIGLGAARRLVDEFRLESTPDAGTRVRMVKWATSPR